MWCPRQPFSRSPPPHSLLPLEPPGTGFAAPALAGVPFLNPDSPALEMELPAPVPLAHITAPPGGAPLGLSPVN